MREILFRGKHAHVLSGNQHIEGGWVEGYLCEENYINSPELGGDFFIDHETVCQYTGLDDKDGRKIFEGDIVKLWCMETEWTARVEFGNPQSQYTWGWNLVPIGRVEANTDILLWVEMEDGGAFCEIIGNIFDTPELGCPPGLSGSGDKETSRHTAGPCQ